MIKRMIAFFKPENKRLHIAIITLVFLLAFLVCGIVNLVVDRRLSWSLLVLGILVFAWVSLFMLIYMRKNSWLWALGSMCALVIPLLFWIEFSSDIKGWTMPLGVPVAGIGIAYIVIFVVLFRYIRINLTFKLGTAIALMIPVSISINGLVCRYLNDPFPVMQNLAQSLIILCASLVFFVMGLIGRDIRRKKAVHVVKQADEQASPPV